MAFNKANYERYRENVLDIKNLFSSEYNHDGCMAVWTYDRIEGNPYDRGTFEWYEWLDGYLDADLILNGLTSYIETAKVQVRGHTV